MYAEAPLSFESICSHFRTLTQTTIRRAIYVYIHYSEYACNWIRLRAKSVSNTSCVPDALFLIKLKLIIIGGWTNCQSSDAQDVRGGLRRIDTSKEIAITRNVYSCAKTNKLQHNFFQKPTTWYTFIYI